MKQEDVELENNRFNVQKLVLGRDFFPDQWSDD